MRVIPSGQAVASARLAGRAWPLAFSALSLVVAAVLWFAWDPVVLGRSQWYTPADIWSAYRSAHYLGWGDFGSVYAAGTHLVAFPGMLVLLAPVAAVTGALGMSESFPFTLAHPTAWLVLGPAELLLGCVALFALDALAERLGVGARRRALLCGVEAVVLFSVTAIAGHPEDALAVGLAAYGLVLALDRRWSGAGWLLGAAIAVQPLVVLVVPVVVGLAGARRASGLVLRCLLPAMALLAVPLAAEPGVTVHALVDQPNYPLIDHMTPWAALAPHIGGRGRDLAVAAGPGRALAVAVAVMIGLAARRWRRRPDLVVWGCALALALRCFTESVMDPFYIWPALALALVAAARCSASRLVAASFLSIAVTVFADFGASLWGWWLPVTGAIVAVLGASVPMNRMRLGLGRAPRPADVVPGSPGLLAGAAR